jgi:hypothetical protein
VHWVKQFLTFSAATSGDWKHPAELGTAEVEAFLNDLVSRRRLSASAQNQALCALVFLYTEESWRTLSRRTTWASSFCSARDGRGASPPCCPATRSHA